MINNPTNLPYFEVSVRTPDENIQDGDIRDTNILHVLNGQVITFIR
ncbi:hypothetical protein ALNOE001_11790 [Candidatus Methanobinarius endosymbioticus]|uniref:Uncharacterized protein n=1 Tax=Candidatus Methanobinarius endosymbioticus TaxID=2006182 RepID=A0A366MA38_9EURY|nr:hypothetical protein ALNOE001_11790 [Candidatus Methanobinarius endosymbioticus]